MVGNGAQPHKGVASSLDAADEAALRRVVRRVIAEQIATLPSTLPGGGRGPDPAGTTALVQSLAPVVQALVREAVRDGLALRPSRALPVREPRSPQHPPTATLAQREGRLTLFAGPFAGYTQVRGFLDDLARIPRIVDVQPTSFTGGRLTAVLQSEYTDTQALIDRLTTDLAPYRLAVRSVQAGSVELVVRRPVP